MRSKRFGVVVVILDLPGRGRDDDGTIIENSVTLTTGILIFHNVIGIIDGVAVVSFSVGVLGKLL
jgi:hypothetical protein